jgi:hypothetical protein
MSMPPKPQFERELGPSLMLNRWIIWDPIPDWLGLKPEILNQIFIISLDIQKEHLAVEQRKLDMVKEIMSK